MALFSRFGGNKSKIELYAALDLGTEQIKCLVFEPNATGANIVGRGSSRHIAGSLRGGIITDLPTVIETAKNALSEAFATAEDYPLTGIVISLPSDLVKSLVTTVHYHRSHPDAHLDASELKNIIYKVQLKAYEQMRKILAKENDQAGLEVKLINTAVIDIQVDGYKVVNPLGFQGSTVSVTVFNAFAPLVHLGNLQQIASELSLDLLGVVAAPYAVSKNFSANDAEFSGILIEVGAHLTDVIVMQQGGIVGHQSFALGGSLFDKAAAGVLKVSVDKAEQIKIDYANGLLNKRSQNKLHEVFKPLSLLWSRAIGLSIVELKYLDILPNKIYLLGGASPLPEIRNALMTKDWSKDLPFTKKPYPTIASLILPENITANSGLEFNLSDAVVLGLVQLSSGVTHEDDAVNTILKRIVLSMQI